MVGGEVLRPGSSRARPAGTGSASLAQGMGKAGLHHRAQPFPGQPCRTRGWAPGPRGSELGTRSAWLGPMGASVGEKAPNAAPQQGLGMAGPLGTGGCQAHEERGVPRIRAVREPHFPARLPAPSRGQPSARPGSCLPRQRGRDGVFTPALRQAGPDWVPTVALAQQNVPGKENASRPKWLPHLKPNPSRGPLEPGSPCPLTGGTATGQLS